MIGKQISAEDFHSLLKDGLKDSLLVDVRTPDEFGRGAIADAINLPLDDILNQIEKLKQYKTVYLYCLSGGRSELALAQLAQKDLPCELVNITGGILAWRGKGYSA